MNDAAGMQDHLSVWTYFQLKHLEGALLIGECPEHTRALRSPVPPTVNTKSILSLHRTCDSAVQEDDTKPLHKKVI